MTITAKYPGTCKKCGRAINEGDRIEWSRETGAYHETCPTLAAPEPGVELISLHRGSGYGGRPFEPGRIVKNDDGQYLVVVKASQKYFRYDGLSFGVGDDQGYIYSAQCRPATEAESAPVREAAERAAQEKANRRLAEEKVQEIIKTITTTGERPTGSNSPEGEIVYVDQRHLIYGGGNWFVIGPDAIWYVKNNGMDGDNWEGNNVRTGGAGAIGWRAAYSTDLDASIRRALACRETGEALEEGRK